MNNVADDATNVLRRTPELLRALLIGLPDSWTDTTDVTDGWRPRDVVGHLITGELTDWIERTRRTLEHGTALPFDTFDRFAHADRDADATLDDLVERFATLRAENLARLDALMIEGDLDRRGLHPSLGEVTLRDCSPRGRCTISITSPRSSPVWRAPTMPRSGRGRRISASCCAVRIRRPSLAVGADPYDSGSAASFTGSRRRAGLASVQQPENRGRCRP